MSKAYEALNDMVIVAPQEVEKVTAGGILLPDEDSTPIEGLVLSAGSKAVEMGVNIGDKVLFFLTAGKPIRRDYPGVLVKAESLICKVS